MKLAAAFALCAFAAVSCRERIPTESGPVTVETVRRWAQDQSGEAVFDSWLTALGTLTNRNDLLTAYARAADSSIVEYLASQSRGELLAKLDTLKRRTNRHPYTKGQLERALTLKETRRIQRTRPKE